MAITTFNYKSERAEKARLAGSFTTSRLSLLSFVMVLLAVGGFALIIAGMSFGWVVLSLAVIPAMIVEWVKGELKVLSPAKDAETVDDVLDSDVLGNLSPTPTPKELATIAGSLYGGQFFSARFGIGSRFLQDIASDDVTSTSEVWQKALDIKKLVGADSITAGIITAALVFVRSDYEQLLARLQLSGDDLLAGVQWQQHIMKLIKQNRQPKRTGGIARDWSFGWIPVLSRFGQNISEAAARGAALSTKIDTQIQAIDALIRVLGTKGSGSAVLVGQDGVGKTEVVYELASMLLDAGLTATGDLRFKQVFMLDASSLISAAPGRGDLEDLITQLLNEAFRAKNVIICLDNAQLFFEEGVGSVDISTLLLPILQAGNLPMIVAMDEQRYLQISSRNPQLVSAMTRINIAPASRIETIAVMQDQLMNIEFRAHVTYMYQALSEAYRLGERYIHGQAMPGRALKLLDAASGYAEDGFVTEKSVQMAIERTMDVKVGVASGEDERDKLLNLENLIHERMINQTRAVSVVSDALRRARAGVRNQNKPIGTFLFLGPTGVGKTELAKALAEVYFGGENRIIRLDMNEFVSSSDVSRLIADGADDSTSLTAQVMKQPFSVILLDEIEKAHPNVLTTFLQVLDEGILRDVKNRDVSFRDAIIIATSNAGADRIREHIERGMDIERFEDQFVDELISSNQFRPEFLNRFDEIVMFRPLNKPELLQVVDLILKDINKTLALQKVSVTVTDDARAYLVDAGYDPRLGARPMRRVVQRAVENTVAKQVLSGAVEAGGVVHIDLDQVKALVSSKQQADEIVSGN